MTTEPVDNQFDSIKAVTHHSVLIENIMTFGAKKPLLSFCIIICLTVIAFFGALQLKMNTSTDSMLNSNDPSLLIYQEVIKEFGSDNITLIHFQHPKLFSVEKLKILEDITYALQDLEEVESVDSLFTTISIRDSEWGLEINPLINATPETAAEAAIIKDNALYSPLLRKTQLSDDGTKAAIMVTLRPSFRDAEFTRNVYLKIEQAIAPLRSEFDQVFQVGNPRIDTDFATGIFADMPKLAPFGIGALALSLILLLRTWLGVFIPLVTASLSIIWTAGLLGYLGIPINLLISIVPTLAIVIGSTEDTHMLSAYLQGLEENKQVRFASIRFMAIHVGLPIFITSITTMIGFLANVLSDITLISHFGIASSLAMLTNLIATILVLPLLLSIMGPRKSNMVIDMEHSSHWMAHFVRFLENMTRYKQKPILIGSALIVICFGFFATQITVSNDPLSFFKADNSIVHDSQLLHENLAGMQVFFITVQAAQNKDFKDPAELQKLELIQQALLNQGIYDKIISINDYLKLVNREMHQADAEFYRLPDSRNLVEQYLMLFQRNDIERVLSSDTKRANFIVRHNISNSSELNGYLAELKTNITAVLAPNQTFSLTSKNLLINQAAESLFIDQQKSLIILVLVVCVLISFLYSSFTAGLIALIPNLIPIVVMFGTMGLLNIPLNPGTALVSVIAIGIAIDDTIHILSTYNKECRIDGDQEAAMIRAIRLEASPVISTSLALAAGFFSHIFSSFHIITQFGLLSALTMLVAMLSDLLVTPVLFKHIRLASLLEVIELKVGEQVLKHCPIFAEMSRFEIKQIILLSNVLEYQAGETVIQQGDLGDKLYVILRGQAGIFINNHSQETMITNLEWGGVFGEAGYAAKIPRTASIKVPTSSEPLQVIVLNQEKVKKSLRFYPRLHAKLNHNISKLLAQRLAESNQRLAAL